MAKTSIRNVLESSNRRELIDRDITRHMLASVTITKGLEDPEVDRILLEHQRLMSSEAAAFKNYRRLDDLLAATIVTDPRKYGDQERASQEQRFFEQRRIELNAIRAARTAAQERQQALFVALAPYENDAAKAEAYQETRKRAANMMNHIPDEWLSTDLDRRMLDLCLPQGRSESMKAELLNVSNEVREEEAEIFRSVIERGSLKSQDRTAFYFDIPVLSVTPEQNVQLMRTNENILRRAYSIRDAGGTVEEVESSLSHIPPEFWPPAFIRELQAWRKVERELADERVKSLMKKKVAPSMYEDFRDSFGFAMDTLGMVGISTDLGGLSRDGVHGATAGDAFIPCAWRDAPGFVEAFAGSLATIQSGWGYGQHVYDALKNGESLEQLVEKHPELSDLPSRIASENSRLDQAQKKAAQWASQIASEAATLASAGIGVATNVGWVANTAKDSGGLGVTASWASDLGDQIPVLCAVAAGIDFATASLELKKAFGMKSGTNEMLQQAERDSVSGNSEDDGGALVRSLINERSARKRQVVKKGVEVGAKAAVLAGEIGLASGVSAGVGLTLKVTGKGIEYGNNLVFAGIDWNIARNAKQLIQEAQAGNPIARLQIMEDSGLYAKMYIAILAKEGNPMATKFIVDRGITEADVRNPAMALSVLREAMLQHANQRDETEVSDNLGSELGESIGAGGMARLLKKAGGAVTSKAQEALGKDRSSIAREFPYNANWTAGEFPISPDQWSTHWSQTKTECEKNAGLYHANTGLKAALNDCVKPVTAANTALATFNQSIQQGEAAATDEVMKKVEPALVKLENAARIALGVHPERNEGGLHEPMGAYLRGIYSTVNTQRNFLNGTLFKLGIKDQDWQQMGSGSTLYDTWQQNWTQAVNRCKITNADEGVGKSLENVKALQSQVESTGENAKKKYEARIKIRAELAKAAGLLKTLWPVAAEFPGLLNFFESMTESVLEKSRENEAELNASWDGNPAKLPENIGDKNLSEEQAIALKEWKKVAFTSTRWNETITAAAQAGFLNLNDGKAVATALTQFEEQNQALNGGGNTSEESDVLSSLANIVKSINDLLSAKPTGRLEKLMNPGQPNKGPSFHEELLQWFIFVKVEAESRAAEISRKQSEINSFDFDVSLTEDAWNRAYQSAIQAKAVPEAKGGKQLSKALRDYDSLRNILAEAKKNPAELRSMAGKLSGITTKIQQAISLLQNERGFSTNRKVIGGLAELRDLAAAAHTEHPFDAILSGRDAPFDRVSFTWDDSDWQKVKKTADKVGLIKKGQKTGFGKAISKIKKLKRSIDKARSDHDKGGKAGELIVALEAMLGLATQLHDSTQNTNFQAYFKQAIDMIRIMKDEYRQLMERLLGGANAPFPVTEFVWENSGPNGWQVVKKKAIKSGLWFEKSKTGFGNAIENIKKRQTSFRRAVLTEEKRNLLIQLIEGLDEMRVIAHALKSNSQNANFISYLDNGISQAAFLRDEYSLQLNNLQQ